MNFLKIKWLAGRQYHPEVGELEPGSKYDVREDLAKAWCEQGAAEPETAEAPKVVRGGKKTAEDKE